MTAHDGCAAAALRAEHDALAADLEVRRSIDHVRRGVYLAFAGLIASGLGIRLGFDRWGPAAATRRPGTPLFFLVAVVVAVLFIGVAAWQFLAARALMRREDARFARLRDLRRQLELDP